MSAKSLHKPLKCWLAILIVWPALVIENAVAGVDFSQVDLFVPFALILPVIALVLMMLAYGIRAVNPYFRLGAHILFVLAVVIFANYLYAYILQLPKFTSSIQTVLFALPIAFLVFQFWNYLTAEPAYTGFSKNPLYVVAAILFLPAIASPIYFFGEKKSSSTRGDQSADYEEESQLDGGRTDGELLSTRRDRALPKMLPAPPPKPIVIFPESSPTVITVNKKSVQTRARD